MIQIEGTPRVVMFFLKTVWKRYLHMKMNIVLIALIAVGCKPVEVNTIHIQCDSGYRSSQFTNIYFATGIWYMYNRENPSREQVYVQKPGESCDVK